jgi:Cu(I)/Ag(I) efflux system membrane protein CusA/SilA
VSVTYQAEYKDDIELLERLPVPTAAGGQVPISQVAKVRRTTGPAMIATEDAVPFGRVFVNVDTDKIGILDFVDQAKKKVATEVDVPSGYFISWAGQYTYEIESRKRLLLVVPLCLVAIFMILYLEFGSAAVAGLVFSALPFAFVGGIALQHLLGYKFSTAVWIGYIALFGVAVEDGLALVEHLNAKFGTAVANVKEAIIEGASWKLRPILMTTITTVLALLPIMLSKGAGSEVMKPIAAPVVGGMVTATLLNLFLVPVLYSLAMPRGQSSKTDSICLGSELKN